VPTVLFAITYQSVGRPIFIYLLLIMIVLATTELGTDSWVAEMLTPVLQGNAAWVLVYTSAIMFVLRIVSSGPLVRALTPVGLLLVCSVMAAGGLLMLAGAGSSGMLVFVAATLYGIGKTFFWPTTLGIVAEQFPRGGALTLNAMGGMGMIAVGALGAPFLGAIQDQNIDQALQSRNPAIHAQAVRLDPATGQPAPTTFQLIRGVSAGPTTLGPYLPLDGVRQEQMPAGDRAVVQEVVGVTKQHTLTEFAILPMIMAVAYAALFIYYRSRGGYTAVELAGAERAH
jgi:MFS family permease